MKLEQKNNVTFVHSEKSARLGDGEMIRRAGREDLPILTDLALALWPHHDRSEMKADLAATMEKDAAFFLAFEENTALGFAQCQLRRDYVEGTESSPVGYLEGIYVAEGHRKQGVARRLLAACEAWARERGCREFASDCELDNEESLRFHLRMGFEEAGRIICFTRKL